MKRLKLIAVALAATALVAGVLAAGVLAAGTALAAAPVTITLRDLAEVKGDAVRIADVAQVLAEPAEVAALIETVAVTNAPEINASLTVTEDDVRAALAKLPLDMSCITIDGAPRVTVSRAGQTITVEDLKAAVRRHVLEHTGLAAEDVLCEFVGEPRAFAVTSGDVTYLVVPVSNKPYSGYQAFSVCVRVDGVEAASTRVAVKIRVFQPVVVTQRRLTRDEAIGAEDLALERREVTASLGDCFARTADVVGKRATRSVSAGVVLTDAMVGQPLAVRRNDSVTLVARRGAVRVRTKGIALKDACVGESVDVMNADLNKVIRARVVGPNLVELSL
jgi:flagella basal body P-ring formation protein FlgA